MKKILFNAPAHALPVDLGLLLMRLVYGYAFILIGSGKIQDPLHWMGPDSVYPGWLQALAAISEFCGGIAMMLGLLTRWAGFGMACTMAVAIYEHKFNMGDPLVNLTGGSSYQLPAAYLVIAVLMLAAGPGRFSADHLIGRAIEKAKEQRT
jgi:putative oxidoreductase